LLATHLAESEQDRDCPSPQAGRGSGLWRREAYGWRLAGASPDHAVSFRFNPLDVAAASTDSRVTAFFAFDSISILQKKGLVSGHAAFLLL